MSILVESPLGRELNREKSAAREYFFLKFGEKVAYFHQGEHNNKCFSGPEAAADEPSHIMVIFDFGQQNATD